MNSTNWIKWISYINWALLALYTVYGTYILLSLNRSGMDAAGRGMAGGFAILFLVFVLIQAGLNSINTKWVKILVLILALLPMIKGLSYKITLFMNTGSWH